MEISWYCEASWAAVQDYIIYLTHYCRLIFKGSRGGKGVVLNQEGYIIWRLVDTVRLAGQQYKIILFILHIIVI